MTTQTKPRYDLLDGLRGVAALVVIVYHLYECFPMDTWPIGHGYLAVDFFFVLSGFVIGYAYDDRWTAGTMTTTRFFSRRLVRLHPMVVLGVAWGLVAFLLQGGTAWDGSHPTAGAVAIATLMALLLIPNLPGAAAEVRGNGEMYPLNGPHWSLFFEYIGNIVYALCIRRMSTRSLAVTTAMLGVAFAAFFMNDPAGYGNIGMGWTLDTQNFAGGMLRMTFSYTMGLLLSRTFKPWRMRGAFWICTALVVTVAALPQLADTRHNCLYEVVSVMVVMPVILVMAASGKTTDKRSEAVCRFLGDISYPLYAIHYPSMYLFYHYIGFPETWRTPGECWGLMLLLLVGNVALAYIVWRFYDVPVRRWLARKSR